MKYLNKLLPFCAACLLIACFLSSAQAQEAELTIKAENAVARAAQDAPVAKSVVRGRAVYDDTNRPVRRARVMLLDMSSRGTQRTGMTNGSGEFQFKDVPAGSYVVMVDAAGIITPVSFIDLEDAAAEKINLEEIRKNFDEVVVNGTNTVNVKVRARRGGAVSGRVTYADGDPAINVRVNIMRKKDGKVVRFITNMNPSALLGIQTDDRGMYRIAGLPPGEYILSASETIDHTGEASARDDYMGMGQMFGAGSLVVTYYQGTTKSGDATAIQVDAGQESNEVNISLLDRGLRTLSGTVVARHDRSPLKFARLTVASKDGASTSSPFPFAAGPNTATDEQGRFTINEIPDGSYTITVEPPYAGEEMDISSEEEGDGEEEPEPAATPAPTGTPKRKFTRKVQDVTINGSDITDLTITLSEGAIVSGVVTVEGGRPLPQTETYFMLESVSGERLTDGTQQNVQPDGRFTIDGLPSGAFYPNVFVAPGDKYYVKAMNAGGTDLMQNPLVVPESANINNVRIVLSPDAATLSGRTLSANNTPVSGVQFALIPADPNKWRTRISYLFGNSEGNGSYSVSGAPGEYLIIFLGGADNPRAVNEAWIQSRAAGALRVTLLPAQRKQMDLTVP
ncbi:MAG: carboxypeptidase regulatory-like domain-containing protein [Pyrinomonadaceae bacterium]|nr:carboxypeptidase regulatory-like domain-containing protein [Pyrinomonadaceae bacterium]